MTSIETFKEVQSFLPVRVIGVDDDLQLERVQATDGPELLQVVKDNRAHLKGTGISFGVVRDEVSASASCVASYRQMEQGQRLNYWLRSTGDILGYFDLSTDRFVDATVASLSYFVVSSAQGQRYATRGSRALLGYGFKERGFSAVSLNILHSNERSQRVASRIGARIVPRVYGTANYDEWRVAPDGLK